MPCGINVICKSAFAFEKKPSGSVDSSSDSESHLDGGRRASLREAFKAERKRATASPISSSRSESGNAARGRPPFFESSRYATLPRRYAKCPSSLRYLLVAGVRRRPTHAPGACSASGLESRTSVVGCIDEMYRGVFFSTLAGTPKCRIADYSPIKWVKKKFGRNPGFYARVNKKGAVTEPFPTPEGTSCTGTTAQRTSTISD